MSQFKDFIPEGEPVPVVQRLNDFVPDLHVKEETVEVSQPQEVEVPELQVEPAPKKQTMFEQVRDAITGAVAYKEVAE